MGLIVGIADRSDVPEAKLKDALAVRSQLRKPSTGPEGMVGEVGEAVTDVERNGKVRVHGELWDARCDRPVRKGEPVIVKALDGMTLIIEPRHPTS